MDDYKGRVALTELVAKPDKFLPDSGRYIDSAVFSGETIRVALYLEEELIATSDIREYRMHLSEGKKAAHVFSFAYFMLHEMQKDHDTPLSADELVLRVMGHEANYNFAPREFMFRLSQGHLGKDAVVREVTGAIEGMSYEKNNIDNAVLKAARYVINSLEGTVHIGASVR